MNRIAPREQGGVPEAARNALPPQIHDHALLRWIGGGAYGDVWLGRGVTGAFRAIKVVEQKRFPEVRAYEREFEGVKHFDSISRQHPAFVNILHVGRNDRAGYFYYVMEVADDPVRRKMIDPSCYVAHTLKWELDEYGRLPLDRCLQVALTLTAGLQYLHDHDLVHRDVKPANIIFANQCWKLADIGLVTKIDDTGSVVGTPGFMAPDNQRQPSADLYSLGKLLYQISTGLDPRKYPELPTDFSNDDGRWRSFWDLVCRACEIEPAKQFRSAAHMRQHFARLCPSPPDELPDARPIAPIEPKVLNVAVLYRRNVQPDEYVFGLLQTRLLKNHCRVLGDSPASSDAKWAREVEAMIAQADAVIALLSPASVESEVFAYELEMAHDSARRRQGEPRLLPVRVQSNPSLPSSLASILRPWPAFSWNGPEEDERLLASLVEALKSPVTVTILQRAHRVEATTGPVSMDSQYYIERPDDEEFRRAIARRDSLILIKGPRQMGKTSLLIRGLRQAKANQLQMAFTDLQKFSALDFETPDKFYLAICQSLADHLADQIELKTSLEKTWDSRLSVHSNFEHYLRRQVLSKISTHLIWGIDEVDRLFGCPFGYEVFRLFCTWQAARQLVPLWERLTLVLAYVTEAHLFTSDFAEFPPIGTRLALGDFLPEKLAELNRLHGSPLKTSKDLARFMNLLGGQPFLVRHGLNHLAMHDLSMDEFESQADRDEGIFSDHLRYLLLCLAKNEALLDVVRAVLRGQRPIPLEAFYRLSSAGVIVGESPADTVPRCRLYADYLRRHLGVGLTPSGTASTMSP